MNDEEWDKVRKYSPRGVLFSSGLIIILNQCWSVNVKSNMYLFREALPTFNANPEGGAFIMTSSTAVSLSILSLSRICS